MSSTPIAALIASISQRSRVLVGAAAAAGVGARLAVFATAVAIAEEDARRATIAAVLAGALLFAQRGATSAARAEVEHDLYRATSRALVESDVLDVPADDVQRVIWDGNHHARMAVTGALPSLVADIIAACAIAPIVARIVPSRVLSTAALALAIVLLTLWLVRGSNARLQARVVEAFQRVNDELLVAIEGRLELVARAGESGYARGFDATLAAYRSRMRRAAFGTALLGRVPLVAGVAVIALVVVVDAAARDAVASAVFTQAVVLAAAAPPVLGVVMSVSEMTRASGHVRPFVSLLHRPPRDDRRSGAPAPELPSDVRAEALGFAYAEGRPEVLSDLSFHWPARKALVVYGPNGSGKSTLLRLLLGLRPPTRGSLTIGGTSVEAMDLVALRRRAALLPQRPYLGEPYATVRQAMRLVRDDATDASMSRALERAGLDVPLGAALGELSAGQRQRVALARVLLQDARFVLLDEPDANLDREGIALVGMLVAEMVAAGKMVVVAAHTKALATPDAVEVTLDA